MKNVVFRLSAAAVLLCFLGLFVLTVTHNHLQDGPGGMGQECSLCKILNSSAYYCVVSLLQIVPVFVALLYVFQSFHTYQFCEFSTYHSRGPPADPFFSL